MEEVEGVAEYQRILQENVELRKALEQVKDRLLKMKSEKDDIEKYYSDLKKSFDSQNAELEQSHQKLVEISQAKREMQATFETQLATWRHSLESKQREMEEVQMKMIQPMDADLIRMKMEKEIEGTYLKELDAKNSELEHLQDSLSSVSKQYELTKSQFENLKYESERELQELRDRHRIELNQYMQENLTLQSRLDDSRDKDVIRTMRRELEEARRRANQYQNEANEMRKERDAQKLEKNDLIIAHSRELDVERNARRSMQSDHERREFQGKVMEEELRKEITKNEQKSGELSALLNEKQATQALLKEKDLLNDTLRRQIGEQKDALRAKERELEETIRKQSEDMRDKFLLDKKEKSKLQKQIESAQRLYQEVEHKRRTEITLCQTEYEKLQTEKQRLQEHNRDMQHKMGQLQDKNETLQRVVDNQMDERDMLDKEYKRLQEKHRQLIHNEAELVRVKEHLEESVKMLQNEKSQHEHDAHHARFSMGNENQHLKHQVHQLASNIDKMKGDSTSETMHYKRKYQEYKQKLRNANVKIQEFGARLARLQHERIALQEGGLIAGDYGEEIPHREDEEEEEEMDAGYLMQQAQLHQQMQRMGQANEQFLGDE